jgi:hypothetical protein
VSNEPPKPLKKPADWDELYPGRFLKAGQLGDRKPTLTIASVDVERMLDDKGQEKVKGVITFKEIAYQLAMNKTNGLVLREVLGRDLGKWIGRRVTLYRGAVESGSQRGEPAVRVWGFPELERDRQISIALSRKKPFTVTVHAVQHRDATRRPEVERHPTEPTNAEPPSAAPPGTEPEERAPDGGPARPF